LIWSAVCASCAVPAIFPEATIYQKDPITKKEVVWMESAVSQTFVDGSLDHDIPMRMLKDMFNVSWFITAQVNPHVRPFLAKEEEFCGKQPNTGEPNPGYVSILKRFVHDALTHGAQQLADAGFPPSTWRWAAVLNQQYTGDLNISPKIRWMELATMVANPTPDYLLAATRDGERATWPKVCRIKNTVAIELALQRGIRDIVERLHFSPEAMAARERSRASRGRWLRGRPQPQFLRPRSLSNDNRREGDDDDRTSSSVDPGSLKHRRNRSLGHLEMTSVAEMTSRPHTPPLPLLSPQAGVNESSLVMTPADRPASG